MRNFNDNRRSGGGNSGRFGGRNQGGSEMHHATCSDCGRDCEVPFRPTGRKPVFCSDCFRREDDFHSNRDDGGYRDRDNSYGKRNKNSYGGDRDFGRRDFDDSGFGEKRMYHATCSDCGCSCEVPFKPTSGKPVYCNDCFGTGGDDKFSKKKNDKAPKQISYKEDFEMLNKKLDKVLKVLEIIKPKKSFTIEKPVEDIQKEVLELETEMEEEAPKEKKKTTKAKVAKKETKATKEKKVLKKAAVKKVKKEVKATKAKKATKK